MFTPIGDSDSSGFYFEYPDSWKSEDMNVQVQRMTDPCEKLEDLSIVYDDSQTSSVSSDTLYLYHGTGHGKPILRLGNMSRKLIIQTIDGINAIDKIDKTYENPDSVENFLSDNLDIPDLHTREERDSALTCIRLFRPGLCNYIMSLPSVVNEKMKQWAYTPKQIDIGSLYAPMMKSIIRDIAIEGRIYYDDEEELKYLGNTLTTLKDINNIPKWPYNTAVGDTSDRLSGVDPKFWCRNERKFALEVADKLPLTQETKYDILSAENPWIADLRSGGNPPLLDMIVENYTPDQSYDLVQQKWDRTFLSKKSLIAPILAHNLMLYPSVCGITFKENSMRVTHVRQTHRHRFLLTIDLSKVVMQDQWPWYLSEEYPVGQDDMTGTQIAYANDIQTSIEPDKIDNKFTQSITHDGNLIATREHYGTVDVNSLIADGYDLEDDNCVYFTWGDLNEHNSDIHTSFAGQGGQSTCDITYTFEWELKQKQDGSLSGVYGGNWPSKAIGDRIESLDAMLIQKSHIGGFDDSYKSTECISKIDGSITLTEDASWSKSLSCLSVIIDKVQQPFDGDYWSCANDWYSTNQIDFQWPVSLNTKQEAEIDYAKEFDQKITISFQSGMNLENARCRVTQFDENGKPLLWVVECWDWTAYSWIKCLDEFEPINYETWILKLPEEIPQGVIEGDGSDAQCFKDVDADYSTDLHLIGEFSFK